MAADLDQVRDKKELDAWRARPEHWKGEFYYNKQDRALFVPKRSGYGLTLNFANNWSYVVVLLPLVFIAIIMWLLSFARKG